VHIVGRLVRVNAALWSYLLWWGGVRTRLLQPSVPPAQRLAAVLERLGTTFVKLGQGLAQHRELLPDDYVAALARLHDRVESFPFEEARVEVEAAFDRPLETLFSEFDPTPLAAGSVAQVHRACLQDGQSVIVKVRRPGIRRQVTEDVRILRWFVRSVQWIVPGLRRLRPLELVDELARNLQSELDFRREADHIASFAEAFRDSATVFVPRVIGRLYSERVIVQEMSPGVHIADPALHGRGPELAQRLVDAYVHQFFIAGVFHGDPHPGNLFVLADGRICLHDFGLVGYLDRHSRISLIAVMLAFAQRDGAWLLDAYIDLGIVAGPIDRPAFQAAMDDLIREYARKPLKDWSFADALLEVARLGRGRNARLPHHLLVLTRALFLMESSVRQLDPEFNLTEGLFIKAGALLAAETASKGDWIMPSRLQYEATIVLQQLPGDLGRLLHGIRNEGIRLPSDWRGLEALRGELERGSSRIAVALVALGLYVAASLLVLHSPGQDWREAPPPAWLGYAAALGLSWRLARDLWKKRDPTC